MFQLNNPYNQKEIATFKAHTEAELTIFLKEAETAVHLHKQLTDDEKRKILLEIANQLENNKQHLAHSITQEIGKPISQSIAEVAKCAWLCKHYADIDYAILHPQHLTTDANESYKILEPLGVLLGIMPWNYPLWQVFRFLIPAIVVGNAVLLKHAPNTFLSAQNIENLLQKTSLTKGFFKSLFIDVKATAQLIKHPSIKAVTLTGSTKAGAEVAKIAGAEIKKTVLELGGNNALLVMKDAPIAKTVDTCVQARFQNTGQSCIAGKRLYVHEAIYKEFLTELKAKVKQLKVGNPEEDATYIGVLARKDLAKNLNKQLEKSIEMGAQLVLGGSSKGTYFEPTLVENCHMEMPVFNEETFGPLLGIAKFKEIEEAIDEVNKSEYGLGVSIFTENVQALKKYIPKFNEGAVFVNELVKSDPRLPFGGVKKSGYGRELSTEALVEFANIKTVYINTNK